MSPIQRFIDFLNANAPANGTRPRGQQPPNPAQGPAAQSTPGGSPSPSGSHHIERKTMVFRHIGPNDTVAEEEKQWRQNGGAMEGDTVSTRAITASGQVADPSQLQSVCSQCHRLEDTVIRSEISHATLCRTCQRIFEMPTGQKVVCTPQEYAQMAYRYDTWARFDARRKGGAK